MKRSFPPLLIAILAATLPAAGPAGAAPAASAPPEIAPYEVKRAMQGLAPGGLRITDVAVSGLKVTVKGASQNNEQVSRFMRAVEGSQDFKSASLRNIGRDAAGSGVAFDLSAEVKCPKPGEKAQEGSLCAPGPKPSAQTIYKCRVNGTFTVQSTPCEK